MSSNVPELFRSHRAPTSGEMIADAAVHAVAIIAGVIGFSVLFQKIALHGAYSDGAAMAVYAAGSSCCSASPAPTT